MKNLFFFEGDTSFMCVALLPDQCNKNVLNGTKENRLSYQN
jgi:hypothetical protein